MKTAVIIEDDEINRFAFRKTLEELDIEVVAECSNYADSLESIINHKPDLVLMDHNLIECKGIDIYKAAAHVVKNTKFIYITSEENVDTMIEIVNSGISNVLLKKSGIEKLKNTINEIVKGKLNGLDELQNAIEIDIEVAEELKKIKIDKQYNKIVLENLYNYL